MQVAAPGAPHRLHVELKIAARLIERDQCANLDTVALARREPHRLGPSPEHHRTDLGASILQREIPVAACGAGQVGNFAANPDQRETAFEQAAHGAVQLGNREDFPHESWLGRRGTRRDGACGGKPIHKPSPALDVDRNACPPSEEIFKWLI